MLQFITTNAGTLAVGLFVLAIVGAVIIKLVKNKRAGIGSCGCGCESCTIESSCTQTHGE